MGCDHDFGKRLQKNEIESAEIVHNYAARCDLLKKDLKKANHYRKLWKLVAKDQFKEAELATKYWSETLDKYQQLVFKLTQALDIPCIGTDYGVSFNDGAGLLEALVDPLREKFSDRLKEMQEKLKDYRKRLAE